MFSSKMGLFGGQNGAPVRSDCQESESGPPAPPTHEKKYEDGGGGHGGLAVVTRARSSVNALFRA